MKTFISTLLILISLNVCAQEINFTPNWKKGTKKKILIKSETKKSKKEGKWEIESKEFNASLLIKTVNKDHYIVKVTYKDFFLNSFQNAFDIIGNNPTGQKKLDLLFKVSKDGRHYELVNWKDAKEVIDVSFNDLSNALDKVVGKDSTGLKFFNPFSMLFTQKMVQSMFSSEMEALLAPYKSSWSTDTVKQSKNELNPFGKGENDSLKVFTINWIDKNKGNTYSLGSQDVFDMEKFEEMMKTVMQTMFNGFMKITPDTTSEKFIKKKQELDKMLNDMSFNIQKKKAITFDKKNGFVMSYRSDSNTEGSIMGRPIKSITWSEVTFE